MTVYYMENNRRETVVLLLSMITEIGLIFQFVKPNYFFNSAMIIVGTGYTIARILVFLQMVAMAVLAVSVYRGNENGRLQTSYFIMVIYLALMIVLSLLRNQYTNALDSDTLRVNSMVYLASMFVAAAEFLAFVVRERGGIHTIPKLSTILLLVIIGQFWTNGLIIEGGEVISHPVYLVFGLVCALPYITVFVFEYFILEPTMLKYR